MMRNVVKKIVAVGLAIFMAVGVVLITPPVPVFGDECAVPHTNRPYNDDED